MKDIPTIEKGIPFEKSITQRGRPCKYPFKHMEVGDSFFVLKNPKTVLSAAYAFAKYSSHKKIFVTKKEGDGTRCWRIE